MSIAPAIEIQLSPRALALIERYQAMPKTILRAVQVGVDKAMPSVLADIQEKRLLGKGPFPVEEHRLGQRTSDLTRRAYTTPSIVSGTTVTARIGTPVPYARVHEFGFSGDVQVRGHARKHSRQVEFLDPSKKRGYRKRKTRVADVEVKAHTRHMKMPAREPFGHGLADAAPILMKDVSNSITTALDPTNTTA